MKHQQVTVDYWTMVQSMFTYGILSVLCWIMLRLFHAVFSLPRRLKAQQEHIDKTVKELQMRFPDLNITRKDLENIEKELDDLTMYDDEAGGIPDDKLDKEAEDEPKDKPEEETDNSIRNENEEEGADNSKPNENEVDEKEEHVDEGTKKDN